MKYQFIIFCISIIGLLNSCVPVSTSSNTYDKELIYDNVNYELNVGMVQLFPYNKNLRSDLENPAVVVNNQEGFYLQFDLFQDNYTNMNVRYIHCNRDWLPSNLADIRFLEDYNSFTINNYQYSANTREPYVQYSIRLPTPKISGNYLIVVSNTQSDRDIILSRRALVYEQSAATSGKVNMSSTVRTRDLNQQISFSISYQEFKNINPLQDIYVVLLQNHNWKVSINGLKPTLIRHDQKYLEYRHFNSENDFPGLNEFRYFDLRSIEYRGMNVLDIQKEESKISAFLGADKPRTGLAYSQLIEDLNGNYFLVNSDPGDSQLQSEYSDVYFELISEPIEGTVYVAGNFNNWQLNSQNQMQYNDGRGSYRCKIKLKQGYYDYMYWVDSNSLKPNYLEGNHFQTGNDYEVLVYFRDPARNFDELVGYKSIKSNF